jgi:hypothetical protein
MRKTHRRSRTVELGEGWWFWGVVVWYLREVLVLLMQQVLQNARATLVSVGQPRDCGWQL